jgi:hypothetical protein
VKAFLCGALLVMGCSGQPTPSGISEPIQVRYGAQNAQFRSGDLPGSRALTSQETLANVQPKLPSLTLNGGGGVVRESDTGFALTGSTSSSAVAIGIRFLDLGSGYWVLPVAAQDSVFPDVFIWSATADFGANIPPGFHQLGIVAIDALGHGGTQVSAQVCVASDIPDNLNACSPSVAPPATVLSLVWDTPVDLDLRVITPSGKVVDPKHPTTADPVDGKVDPTAAGTGVFDTDALRDCVDTGHRRENLVWQQAPTPGRYVVYANLYDACGQSSVHFNLSINQPTPGGDGGALQLTRTFELNGELLAVDANAGDQLGLFVTEFVVQ